MNRPRNRQPRGDGQQQTRARGRGGYRGGRGHYPSPDYKSVPSIQEVVPGAEVSIVLKEDQPTGKEVQGIVQDLLTRGNHPRGIKVRLRDGRVGRVQRMSTVPPPAVDSRAVGASSTVFKHATDARDYADGPPPRTFADFMPDLRNEHEIEAQTTEPTLTTATAKCPICEEFEGDEIAVSRHVEDHFSSAPCA